MELYLIAALIILSVVMIAASFWPNRKEEEDTVMRRMSGKKKFDTDAVPGKKQQESSAAKLMQKVAPFAMRPALPKSDQEMSMLRVKLANAGFRKESASTIFLASKSVLAIGLGGLVLTFMLGTGQTPRNIFGFAIFAAGVGFMLPNLWLAVSRKQRGEEIRMGLPDALDLMVISVESGLALDAAIQRVANEFAMIHPALSEELSIATHETTMGVPRAEALESLAIRTGVPEVKSLVAIVTQAEKFGTSIAKALRNQSDALRTKRRQQAEERAQKTAVKLMAPLILFIFPAIFVVLVGPAVLRMIRTFSTNSAFQ